MANKDYSDILRQGQKIWNDWRNKNPDITPDLQDASFQDIDLSGYNLEGTGVVGISRARNTKCWKCHMALNSSEHEACPNCDWGIICPKCRVCYCDKSR